MREQTDPVELWNDTLDHSEFLVANRPFKVSPAEVRFRRSLGRWSASALDYQSAHRIDEIVVVAPALLLP